MSENDINHLTPQNEKTTFYFKHKVQVLTVGNNNLKKSVGIVYANSKINNGSVFFLDRALFSFNMWKYIFLSLEIYNVI